jgi:hypothetical protein
MRRMKTLAPLALVAILGCTTSTSSSPIKPDGGTTVTHEGGTAAGSHAGADAGQCKIDTTYNPTIDPADFVAPVDNPFFTLTPGTTRTYKAGDEIIEFTVLAERKDIIGVSCVTVHEQVKVKGKIVEEATDWFAQDKSGTVWSFGQDTTKTNKNGSVTHEGSWLAGVDGAKPGIQTPGTPKVGPEYRQDYYGCHAEDYGEITDVNATVTVGGTTYKDCLKTHDTSAIDPKLDEDKYYCKGKGVVLIISHPAEDREELTSGP